MIENELYHYGVKGMKWGVRRYQNYDGSYTQKGLKRYRDAESAYDTAKANRDSVKESYKSGTATKQQYMAAKGELKTAKRKMSDAYGKLKIDNQADKGKKLYAQGKTIESNTFIGKHAQIGLTGGRLVANSIIRNTIGGTKIGNISSRTISIGTAAAQVIIAAKIHSENKKLRAYYAH